MHKQSTQLKPGSEVLVRIERILPGGLGLSHADGATLFVALSAPGDSVRVRIEQLRGKVGFASVLEVVEPSPDRTTPPCTYFGRCGGCDFQQLSYAAQLAAKVDIIRDCLRRIAHLDFKDEIPITPSPTPLHYRSSAQWKFDPVKSHLGYFERGSHTVCDVVECPILTPNLQELFQSLRDRMHDGTLPADTSTIEAVGGDDGISLHPDIEEVGTRNVSLRIRDNRYEFNADLFFQINHGLLPALIDAATKDAHGDTALDLYCGVGLFTLPLSQTFKRVLGVEADSGSVKYARRNLDAANLQNAAVACSTVREWLQGNATSVGPVDLLLLDPPRMGAERESIEGILNVRPRRIVYVSCDPATLARDLRGMIDGGYSLDSVAAFDMFPQTHHVETVATLSVASS